MRLWIVLAALNGLAAVVAGAWGWHMMQGEGDSYLPIFQVGVRYQMWHALALFAVAWMADRLPGSRLVVAAGWSFTVGTLLFSGTLYVLSLTGTVPMAGIAPLGGTLLMAGWILCAVAAWRARA